MTTVSKPKSGYEKWQDDIDWAVPDATRETLTTVAGGAYEKSSAFWLAGFTRRDKIY